MPSTSRSPLATRFRPLLWLGIAYLIIGVLTRIVLLAMTGSGVPVSLGKYLYAFGIGLGYDLVTFLYLGWPLLLFLWIVPARKVWVRGLRGWAAWLAILVAAFLAGWGVLHAIWQVSLHDVMPILLVPLLFVLPLPAFRYGSRVGQGTLYLLALLLIYGLLFVAVAELVFWNEFGTRFNFIAVDYLVYTTEVIGNIRESYPIGTWLSLLALAAVAVIWLSKRPLRTSDDGTGFWQRGKLVGVWLVLTVLSVAAIKGSLKDHNENAYVNELAGNGTYQFFAAFRSSHLDYSRFYRTLPLDEAFRTVRAELQTPDATYLSADPHDLTREIRHAGPERHLNVVLISVESLSGDYLGTFGNKKHLTPNLDALVGQSLFFDHLYANGTRTVRGLEALSLSVPPTPGDSLIKAHNNENLFSLADIFNDRGYESEFVYGGYGYFDNMNYFFEHNGYKAVDRNAIPKDAVIHGENVWGVSDEDLFTLALQRMDQSQAQGKPFFLHIMTTSNHRPFTFPAGRVNLPSGERDGAVAYTDWAIGDFIKRAREKPYFKDTVFVITADHCASSAGRTAIPINRYHIPLWIYSPSHIPPQRVERMTSQIDIAPTLLGLLNFSYRSRFFGYDIFSLPAGRERAFPATYQKLGYLHDDWLTILEPQRKVEQVHPDFETGDASPAQPQDPQQIEQATASYQVAAWLFKHGQLGRRASDSTRVQPLPAPSASTAAPVQP